MSRREEEKKKALDALGRIAYAAGSAPPPAPPKAPAPKPKPRASPSSSPSSSSSSSSSPWSESDADRARKKQLQERKEKLAEEKALRDRRAQEVARAGNLAWRGMDRMGVPASIRRTGFDRQEATVSQKLHDILGDQKEKESRAKAREKGKRAGGKRG